MADESLPPAAPAAEPAPGPSAQLPPTEGQASPAIKAETDPRVRKAMRKMAKGKPDVFESVTAMMMSGPVMGHPLHHKMDGEHITKVLDLATQHDSNEHDLKKRQQEIDAKQAGYERLSHFGFFIIFVSPLVFILSKFASQPAVLTPLLTGIGGAVGGFLTGIGYAKSKAGNGK